MFIYTNHTRHQQIRASERIQRDVGCGEHAVTIVHDEDETKREDGDHVQRERHEEEEEVAIVAPTHAIVHPRTVMVKRLQQQSTSHIVTCATFMKL